MGRILATLAALAAGGCTPGIATTTVTFTHSANVLPPGGPGIGGTPLRPRSGAAELSLGYNANSTGSELRAQGGTGQRNADLHGSARVLFRAGPVEVGPSADWSFGPDTPASPDNTVGPGGLAFRLGVATRVHFVERPRWTIGLNAEAYVTQVPYRTIRGVADSFTPFTSCDDPGAVAYFGSAARCLGLGGAVGVGGPTTTTSSSSAREASLQRFDMRLGLFAGGAVSRSVWLLGGLLTQTHPTIRGVEQLSVQCVTSVGTCDGLVEPRIPSGSAFVGTLWFGVGVDVGAVSLYAQVHANPLGPSEIVARAPFGVAVNTRFNFDL